MRVAARSTLPRQREVVPQASEGADGGALSKARRSPPPPSCLRNATSLWRGRIFALALAAIATPALAQTDSNAEVRAVAKAFDDAQLQGDRAALERLLAADFLFVRGSGRVGDRRDFIDGFTSPGQKLEPFRIEDPLFLRVTGDVAIVGGEAWIKGTDAGKPFAEHFRYSDTFAKRDGKWVAVYTQVTGLP